MSAKALYGLFNSALAQLKSAFPARFKNLSAGEESYLFIRCFLYGEVLLN